MSIYQWFQQATLNDKSYISLLKVLRQHISRKYHELVRNFTLHYDYLARVFLFLFRNILVNATLKLCHTLLTVQISLHAIPGCFLFPGWLLLIRKFNIDFEVILAMQDSLNHLAEKNKKLLYPFKKVDWTMGTFHILWEKLLWKRMIHFLLKIYFLIFYDFYSRFLGNAFIRSKTLFCNY